MILLKSNYGSLIQPSHRSQLIPSPPKQPDFRSRALHAVSIEESLGNESMKVRMKVEVLDEGVEGEKEGGKPFGLMEGGAENLGEGLLSDGAEEFEQSAVS